MTDLDGAMKNPGSVFGTPEALYESGTLTAEQKRAVLLQWKDQLQQLQAADDEGMHNSEAATGATGELLRRVTSVLYRIEAGESSEQTARPNRKRGGRR